MANVPIQLKRIATQAAAAASDAVLLSGQCIYVQDSRRMYVGNGSSTLGQLVADEGYLLPNPEFVQRLGEDLTNLGAALTTDLSTYADQVAQDAYEDAKAYTDSMIAGAFRPAGDWDASVGPWPTAGTGSGGTVRAGDVYKVKAAGDIGTTSFDLGDSFYAIVDAPGQDDENWARFEANDSQATESYRGTARIATETEAIEGSDNASIMTPRRWWDAFASAFSAIGQALRLLPTPDGPRWLRANSSGMVSMRTDVETRSDLGLGNSATRNVGTTGGTVCAGDDARLSDARTPTAHSHTRTDIGEVRAVRRTQFDHSGTALTDVPSLEITIPANSEYLIDFRGAIRSPATNTGVNVTLWFDGSPDFFIAHLIQMGASGSVQRQWAITVSDGLPTPAASVTDANSWLPCTIRGLVYTGANPCTIRVRLARGGTANSVSIIGALKGTPA